MGIAYEIQNLRESQLKNIGQLVYILLEIIVTKYTPYIWRKDFLENGLEDQSGDLMK